MGKLLIMKYQKLGEQSVYEVSFIEECYSTALHWRHLDLFGSIIMFWPNSLIEETLLQRFSDFSKVTDLVYDLQFRIYYHNCGLYIFPPTMQPFTFAESVIKTFNTSCMISAGFSLCNPSQSVPLRCPGLF